MSVVVFCGPTLSAEEVTSEIDAEVRPPAARGDVLRAALEGNVAIGLVDGYFNLVPAVWHKEILWALANGIHVFGASSMGALRAVELAPFGMVGVGEIYEGFARGDLEDDDEVAVSHGSSDSGFRCTSDAMVNIRWTLRAAERQGVIGPTLRNDLEALAKAMPYDRRDLRLVIKTFGPTNGREADVARLRAWLPAGRVDQKRADALAMLRHMAALADTGWASKSVDFQLSETDGWHTLRTQVEAHRRLGPRLDSAHEDELRVRGLLGLYLRGAVTRTLVAERLRDRQIVVNARAVEAWIDDFRRERELLTQQAFEEWVEESALDEEGLVDFFKREAAVRATQAELRARCASALEDELRANGMLADVRASVAQKRRLLEDNGALSPSLAEVGLSEEGLWAWFFSERLGTAVPPSLSAYAAREGSTIDELRAAALREFAFLHLQRQTSSS